MGCIFCSRSFSIVIFVGILVATMLGHSGCYHNHHHIRHRKNRLRHRRKLRRRYDCGRFLYNTKPNLQTKFQNLDQISVSRPNFRFSTKFQILNQISESRPNFRILTKFQNFYMEIDLLCEWCKIFFVSECFNFVRMCNEI